MPVPTDAAVGTAVSGMQPVLIGGADGSAALARVELRIAGASDGNAFAAPSMMTVALGWLFNGTTFDRIRAASAAVLSAFSSLGAMLVHLPGDWSQFHIPAAATLASSTKAAGAAGVRHVCTSLGFAVSTGATGAGFTVTLRDGASGAGTSLWAKLVVMQPNTYWSENLTGLNIVGSPATAMTLEFTAAGPAASFETVVFTGHEAA